MNEKCLHCGQTREQIKKNKTYCATVDYWGECQEEWDRHRFKPWSKKELEKIAIDEAAFIKHMGDFAESYNKWAEEENKKLSNTND